MAFVGLGTTTVRADGLDPLMSAIDATKPLVDIRLRSESVTHSGFAREAEALLLRSRLGFQTGKLWGTSLLAEGSFLTPLIDRYDDGLAGNKAYPYIPDPENYELHRLQLENTSLPGTDLVLGRQRVALDDWRFVGPSNWRLNENTLNSGRIINTSVPGLTIDLTYFNRFNRRTTRASTRLGALTGNSYLANVGYETGWGKFTAFDYLLSFKEVPTLSSKTAGARFQGEHPVAGIKLAYTASWARQTDYASNPVKYSADYYYLDLTGTLRQYSLGVGTESLGGNGTIGLSTPLSSYHSWDGFAGMFTTTPTNGLNSKYVTLGYSVKAVGPLDSIQATARYYDFHSARLGQHYGSELDLQLQASWHRFSGLVAVADYASANRPTTQSSRSLWLEVDYIL